MISRARTACSIKYARKPSASSSPDSTIIYCLQKLFWLSFI
jgi:hypothetical protein